MSTVECTDCMGSQHFGGVTAAQCLEILEKM